MIDVALSFDPNGPGERPPVPLDYAEFVLQREMPVDVGKLPARKVRKYFAYLGLEAKVRARPSHPGVN